jgi:hypothetical protein
VGQFCMVKSYVVGFPYGMLETDQISTTEGNIAG